MSVSGQRITVRNSAECKKNKTSLESRIRKTFPGLSETSPKAGAGQNRSNLVILVFAFFTLVAVKFFLAYPTPFVFLDEYVYSSYAFDIANDISTIFPPKSQVYHYPPGYPLALAPIFFFTQNMYVAYPLIILINSVFSSSVIFISYLLLKKYVDSSLALSGSLLISLLPANTLYSFLIFSENLYIPVFLLSVYLVSESFNSKNRVLHLLTGFIIFYLTLVRAFGILAYISLISLFLVKLFYEKKALDFIRTHHLLPVVPTVLLCSNYALSKICSGNLYGYNGGQISELKYALTDPDGFLIFLKLALNEMTYIIACSYVVFFVLFILSLTNWKVLDNSFRDIVLYVGVYGVSSLVLTVAHMMVQFTNPLNWRFKNYMIWGRYLDPLIPLIFIISIIYLGKYFGNNLKDRRFTGWLVIVSAVTIIFFIVQYPAGAWYKLVNVMPIYYVKGLVKGSAFLFYLSFFIASVLLLSLIRRSRTLIIILILWSLLISYPPYIECKGYSVNAAVSNEVGLYFADGSNRGESGIMCTGYALSNSSETTCLICFWALGYSSRMDGLGDYPPELTIINRSLNNPYNPKP